MKVYKVSIAVSAVLGAGAFWAAYGFYTYSNHGNTYGFWSNVFVGIFTGFLVMFCSSIANYIVSEKKIFTESLLKIRHLLSCVGRLFDILESDATDEERLNNKEEIDFIVKEMEDVGESLAQIVRAYAPIVKNTKRNELLFCLIHAIKCFIHFLKTDVRKCNDVEITVRGTKYKFRERYDYYNIYAELHEFVYGDRKEIVI